MKLTILKLILINFKGIRSLTVDFDDTITNIFGDNATGKTTVFDAFTWLFFGKESTDRKEFNIKNTVDRELNRQEHEVSATILVDGAPIKLRRVYKEKWVKKRGESATEFNGHETLFFWDDVPKTQAEYTQKVSAILEESIFKLISNPMYFNSLKWQDRRSTLFEIGGTVSLQEIAQGNSKFEALLFSLTNGKTLDEYKKQIAAKKKLIRTELEGIPTRIDEINRNMPACPDAAVIHAEIAQLNTVVTNMDTAINDLTEANRQKFTAVNEHQTKIHGIETQINQLRFEIGKEIQNKLNLIEENRNAIARQITAKKNELDHIIRQRDYKLTEQKTLESRIVTLRTDWARENEKQLVFDEHAFSCPTCKRAYETDNTEDMQAKMVANFNTDKANRLSKITADGKHLNEELTRLKETLHEQEILSLQQEVDGLKKELDEFDTNYTIPGFQTADEVMKGDSRFIAFDRQIQQLKASMPKVETEDVSDLQANRNMALRQIEELNKSLATETVIAANKNRIAELELQENALSQELAGMEGEEFTIDQFNKHLIETVESRINSKFKLVTFKMFDQQINGGEVETCETMLNGVPFSDLNNAARINAGLDIINTLCQHYGVYAPCFIDNAESITQLINVESQIIRLVVSEQDKQLRVA